MMESNNFINTKCPCNSCAHKKVCGTKVTVDKSFSEIKDSLNGMIHDDIKNIIKVDIVCSNYLNELLLHY